MKLPVYLANVLLWSSLCLSQDAATTQDAYSGKTVSDPEMAMSLIEKRYANAPRPGQEAPDFELYSLKRQAKVSLAELVQEKPTVLLFSSWGCDVFRETSGGFERVRTKFEDRVNFVMVYIRDAHPKGGFGGSLGRTDDPLTFESRRDTAAHCTSQMSLGMEVLIDEVDDAVATRWAAWPTRLYVVNTDGTVGYAGAQGPWGFKPYEGYSHHDFRPADLDPAFNSESLEAYLNTRFPDTEVP